MQENSMHVFVAMRVIVTVVMSMVGMSMLETKDTDQVHSQPGNTDSQEFTDAMHLATRRQPLHCLVDNLQADDPADC
jgi:hypothetical protein